MNSLTRTVVGVLVLAATSLPAAEAPASRNFPTKDWVYTRIDQVEFFSQLPAKQTRELADDFAIFQQFARVHYPEASLPADHPVTVVLCENSKSYRALGGQPRSLSTLPPGSERFILLDISQTYQISRTIHRRAVDLAFRRHPAGKYPLWRELATRELIANVVIKDDRLEIGYPRYFPTETAPRGKAKFLGSALLPLPTLFALTREAPEYQDQDGYVFLTANDQSAAFMQMCLFGTQYHRFREPFQKFLTRLETTPVSEALFRDCFGLGFEEMNRLIRGYAIESQKMRYETQLHHFQRPPPGDVRIAQAAEVLQLLGECQRLLTVAAVEKSR